MPSIKNFLDSIEKRRGSKTPFNLFILGVKDTLWFLGYKIPYQILKLYFANKQYFLINMYIFFNNYRKPVTIYHKISFCITCMNRASHIKKTLAKNIKNNAEYPNLEFVLLDYNSSDDLQEFIFKNFKNELNSGRLVYYQTKKPKYFHMANAKNIAHNLATGDIVCNLDADNYTNKDFAFYINISMQKDTNIIGLHQKNVAYIPAQISDCGGRIFLTKENFLKLGGYNEEFIGWGYEDHDFRLKAFDMGLKIEDIPRGFLKSISHDNIMRTKNMEFSYKEYIKINLQLLEKNKLNKTHNFTNKPIDFTQIKRIQ